jgi:hypothetical protein
MMIVRGVNIFPTQVEELILQCPGLAPHYQIELTREGRLDDIRPGQPITADVQSGHIGSELVKSKLFEVTVGGQGSDANVQVDLQPERREGNTDPWTGDFDGVDMGTKALRIAGTPFPVRRRAIMPRRGVICWSRCCISWGMISRPGDSGGGAPVAQEVHLGDGRARSAVTLRQNERVLADRHNAYAPLSLGRQACDALDASSLDVEHVGRRSVGDEQAQIGRASARRPRDRALPRSGRPASVIRDAGRALLPRRLANDHERRERPYEHDQAGRCACAARHPRPPYCGEPVHHRIPRR